MTILNEVAFDPSIAWSIMGMAGIALLGYLLMLLISYVLAEDITVSVVISLITSGILIVVLLLSGIRTYNEDYGKKTIECLITDEATFKDITDKYILEDKRGDIYILKEKERSSEENGGGDNN